MARKTVIAVDLGAESGRVMAVHYDGHRFELEELHRFSNPVTEVRGTLYWDILHLWRHIQQGIEAGKRYQPLSIGVDTWAIDFVLLDAQGNLLSNPVMYRDQRTAGMMETVFSRVPKRDVFAQTGIQFMPINTLYQMMSLVETESPLLVHAQTFLTIPDLVNYWLTGNAVCEFTNATTTQMLDPTTGTWAKPMLEQLDIPTHILPKIVPPGTQLGEYEGIAVIAPATHDTGSAVAGVPTQRADYAYISSGTWSLVGVEVPDAVINDQAFEANVTNEGGLDGHYRLLKNVMGLWILQQCRARWAEAGHAYSYADLVSLAQETEPLQFVIDVDDSRFLTAGDHPQHIQDWCQEHNQPVPQTQGEIVRCVLESLALKYQTVLDSIQAIARQSVGAIHIVGGGTQNELLNQFTANATGKTVIAGPSEATVLGNASVQFIANGELTSIAEARGVIAGMGVTRTYHPQDNPAWQRASHKLFKR
ncbi:MAG: rhamnulokinase [Anaerolineae bacterium]